MQGYHLSPCRPNTIASYRLCQHVVAGDLVQEHATGLGLDVHATNRLIVLLALRRDVVDLRAQALVQLLRNGGTIGIEQRAAIAAGHHEPLGILLQPDARMHRLQQSWH